MVKKQYKIKKRHKRVTKKLFKKHAFKIRAKSKKVRKENSLKKHAFKIYKIVL